MEVRINCALRTGLSLTTVFFFFLVGFGQKVQTGKASFYAAGLAGQRTASGEQFNPKKHTAAHRDFPLGTKVRVTNLSNDRSIVVRINDRGPYVSDRIIDLSPVTARKLGFIQKGVADVAVEKVDKTTAITGKVSEKRKQILAVKADSVSNDFTLVKTSGFYRVNIEKTAPKGYGVQVNSLKNKTEVFELITHLKRDFDKTVYIKIHRIADTKVFSVILGNFSRRSKAKQFANKVAKRYPNAFGVNYPCSN